MLIHLLLFGLLFQFIQCSFKLNIEKRSNYTAASVEYKSYHDSKATEYAIINTNLDSYLKIIKTTKTLPQKPDILVFPEYGLTSVYLPSTPDDLLKYSTIVPDPKEQNVPCNRGNDYLAMLSCAALDAKMYILINIPERWQKDEKSEWIFYNTNVVFDRNGVIIARYRKYNVYDQEAFSQTPEPEHAVFTTDFGATFGTFTCFDILFADPAVNLVRDYKVTDIVFATAWYSELPFLTADQVQQGWSVANQVNFIASSYDDIQIGAGGSVIRSNEDDSVIYTVPYSDNTLLLHTPIDSVSNVNRNPVYSPKGDSDKMILLKENLTNYQVEFIKNKEQESHVCHQDFCCDFSVSWSADDKPNYFYSMIVYSGTRVFGGSQVENIQVCGIAACTGQTKDTCGEIASDGKHPTTFQHINITGSFSADKTFSHFPTGIRTELFLIDKYRYEVELKDEVKHIHLYTSKEVEAPLGFGIYGVQKVK